MESISIARAYPAGTTHESICKMVKTTLPLAAMVVAASLTAGAQISAPGMMLDRGPAESSQTQQSISTNALRAPAKAQEAVQRAREALVRGRDADAAKSVERALKAYPRYGVALVLRGVLKVRGGQVEEACADFQHAIEHDPNLGAAYAALGSLYNVRGQFNDAAPLLNRAATLLPNAWLVHYESALAYLQTGKIDEARQSISAALSYVPKDPYRRSAIFYLKAQVLLRSEKLSEARAAFAQSISEDPGSESAKLARHFLDRLEQTSDRTEALAAK